MLATVWLLWCVVRASCEPGHGPWGLPREDRCKIKTKDYSVYEFEEDEPITLRCSAATLSHDWMLLWTDEAGGPRYSEAPSSTELRLQLTAGAGDDGALLRCSAVPSSGYDLRYNHHIEVNLKAKSTGGAERSSRPIYLRQGEPWNMTDCDSGWIKQRHRKYREENVYKRGDTIFHQFNKTNNGIILYCNLYKCRSNPNSQEMALSMTDVLECTRTQQQYIFKLNEDSREDTNNKQVRFPDNSAKHPIAGASVGSPGVHPESKQTEETKQGTNVVVVVVGTVLGVVVLALLAALVLLLRHLAAHRNQAPSEPYVEYTELAEGRVGGPPPPPRNLTPYAVVVGTLVPAPKHAPRPISHTYCSVK